MIKVLRDNHGLIAASARQLRCKRQTIYEYMDRFPEVADAVKESREYLGDLAEAKLIERVRTGDLGAICFLLKCLFKDRGYVERIEQTGAGGGPVLNVNLETDDPNELVRRYREALNSAE